MIEQNNQYDPGGSPGEGSQDSRKEEKVFRPLTYICSPYAGDPDGNTEKARRYCRFAVETGFIPFAGHLLLPQFMDDSDPKERELAMFMNKIFLNKCQELWVFGDHISKGMQQEIDYAEKRRKTIRFFTDGMKEVPKV